MQTLNNHRELAHAREDAMITCTFEHGSRAELRDRDERLVDGVLRELREETGWTGEVRGLLRITSLGVRIF